MAQLPVLIRRDIRDKFDSPDAPLQRRFTTLKDSIGYPINCAIDWDLLWTECGTHFLEDKAMFVPNVVSQVAALCDALSTKLEDESSQRVEELLGKIESVQALKLQIQAPATSNSTHGSAAVYFSRDYIFVLTISLSSSHLATMNTQLLQELDSIFAKPGDPSDLEDDDWAGVDTASVSASTSTFEQSHPILTPISSSSLDFPHSVSRTSTFPTLASLGRPDLLFKQSVPYIIHLRHEQNRQLQSQSATSNIQRLPDRIIIQSTHEPSLKLIHDYFSKWTRADPQTRERIPLIRHNLAASCLGPGTCYDTLVIEPFSQVSGRSGSILSPAMYQSFIESVLEYEVVGRGASSGRDAELWEFRRMTRYG